MTLAVRAATEADISALMELDATYTIGRRLLALTRSGTQPELTFSFEWRQGTPSPAVYDEYTPEGLRRALTEATDLFLVAEAEAQIAGLLMVVLPRWTDAGEITDLVVHRPLRRSGVGQALVDAAAAWARERRLRALWVEPAADNDGAIEFYLSLGFRISGFNDRWSSNDTDVRPTIYMHLDLR